MRKVFGDNFLFVNFEGPSKFLASMKGAVEVCIHKSQSNLRNCDHCKEKKIFKEKTKSEKFLCGDCHRSKKGKRLPCIICKNSCSWVYSFFNLEGFDERKFSCETC